VAETWPPPHPSVGHAALADRKHAAVRDAVTAMIAAGGPQSPDPAMGWMELAGRLTEVIFDLDDDLSQTSDPMSVAVMVAAELLGRVITASGSYPQEANRG
jgi:hypothetical protein